MYMPSQIAHEVSSSQLVAERPEQRTRLRSKVRLCAGWILSVAPALLLLSSGVNMMAQAPFVLQGLAHLGYASHAALGLGIVELACSLLYLLPRTSLLGVVLLTAYLGGATASHVRVGEPFFAPILVGILFWAGLFLRDRRLQALLPLWLGKSSSNQ